MSTVTTNPAPGKTLTELPLDTQRAIAREMARNEPELTATQLASRFGRSQQWGRQQITAGHRAATTKPRLLTVGEAAERLGETERYVRRLISERRIRHMKYGTARSSPIRLPETAIDEFLQAATVEAE